MEIKLTKQEAQAIVNYLATKPYAEVYQIVALLADKLKEEVREDKKKSI